MLKQCKSFPAERRLGRAFAVIFYKRGKKLFQEPIFAGAGRCTLANAGKSFEHMLREAGIRYSRIVEVQVRQ